MEREVEEGADADARPPPQPPPSSSSSPPRQSPSPAAAAGSKAKDLRDRVSFSSSASRTRPSCWGSIRIHRIGRSRTGRGEHDAAPAVRTIPSRVCGAGDRARCGCGGKADAAAVGGARTLLQRNDFYCDDCNTHR